MTYTGIAALIVLALLASLGDDKQNCGRALTSVSPDVSCAKVQGVGHAR